MDYLQLVDSMSPAVYRRLLRSVEIGKWPDGRAMTGAQRENALQAIIAWGQRNLPEEERVGFVRGADNCESAEELPMKWQERE